MYLTYDEYSEYGGTLDETAFRNLRYDVEKTIDYYTFGRLKKDEEFSESVKRTEFELITLRERYDKYVQKVSDVENPIVASSSNDGVSQSYGGYLGNTSPTDIQNMHEQLKSDMYDVIKRYLDGERNAAGELLLYRGVY